MVGRQNKRKTNEQIRTNVEEAFKMMPSMFGTQKIVAIIGYYSNAYHMKGNVAQTLEPTKI